MSSSRANTWLHQAWTTRVWEHRWRPVLLAIGLSLVGAWILSGMGRLFFGVAVPYSLLLAVLLAATLGRLLIVPLRPPPQLTPPLREFGSLSWSGMPDRPFADVRRWEERLDWRRDDAEYFTRTVLPAIGMVADERLRLRHGVTRSTDPDRARQLLGPHVSAFLERPHQKAPTPAEIAALVKELESL